MGGKDSKANQDKAYVKGDIKGNKLYNIGTYKHSAGWKKEIQQGGKIGTQVGIKLDTHARVYGSICDNTITKSSQHGIYLRVGSVVKNIYSSKIEDVEEDGISIMESTIKGAIRDNKVTGAKRNGLFVRKGSVVNTVSGNTFKNITHKDIAIQAGGKIKKNI